ncbi:hypothetical protein [Nocardia sp. NPDC058666]|uniref:hypothetical protein n=1 Tax=Nocardia sp. NPDC058666 TaxID=3346587 RepID=UPI003660FCEF
MTNRRSEPLYVAARIPDPDGGYGVPQHYVIPRSDGVVEISKRFFRVVDCPVLRARPVPVATFLRVEPGATLTEQFPVALPLTTIHPEGPLNNGELAPMPARPDRIVFCVGLVPPVPADPKPFEEDGEQRYGYRDFDTDAQTHLCSDLQPL